MICIFFDKEDLLYCQTGVIVTEVCANNKSILINEFTESSDYIKIYNNSEMIINLNGYTLSDSVYDKEKWKFPDISINPYESLVIFADNRKTTEDSLHANFALNDDGDSLFMCDNGRILFELNYDIMLENMVYWLDFNEYKYSVIDTFGNKIKTMLVADIAEYIADQTKYTVHPSVVSGLYDEAFSLQLTANEKFVTIRYTTDGSMPSYNSSVYSEPIKITSRETEANIYIPRRSSNYSYTYNPPPEESKRATVIKAACFMGDEQQGDVDTYTYFVDTMGVNMYTLPIISLTCDPYDLYSEFYGIYTVGYLNYMHPDYIQRYNNLANYAFSGDLWRRDCYIEYFVDGKLEYNQSLKMQIYGGFTRHQSKKSLKLSSKDTGREKINYPIFNGLSDINGFEIQDFDKLVMRNGGNSARLLLFNDALLSRVADEFLATQAAQPVITYINGEYYGIYFLRECVDRTYVQDHYGIDKDNVELIKTQEYDKTIDSYYKDLLSFVLNNDLSIENNYNYIRDRVDIDDMIEYYVFQMYIQNFDWPINNCKIWRYTGEATNEYLTKWRDGKYRFLVYDIDYGLNPDLANRLNPEKRSIFDWVFESYSDEDMYDRNTTALIVKKMFFNEEFKNTFINKYCDRLNENYTSTIINDEIDYWVEIMMPEVSENMYRYDLWDCDESFWYEYLETTKLHVKERTENAFTELANYFNEKTAVLKIDNSEGGYVDINSNIIVAKNDDFSGTYLCDVPITLTVITKEGYRFAGWAHGETAEQIEIVLNSEELSTFEPIFKEVAD